MRAETEAAIRAARHAQEIADSRAGADQITSKGGIDLVTAADVACEDKIREELLLAFPDYPVIGEERGGEPVDGRPYWLVDPICGTRLFASNIPLYCHNIALVENGEVTVAAVGVAKSKEILFAEKGQGSRDQQTANEGFQCPTAVMRSGLMVGRVSRTFCGEPFSRSAGMCGCIRPRSLLHTSPMVEFPEFCISAPRGSCGLDPSTLLPVASSRVKREPSSLTLKQDVRGIY